MNSITITPVAIWTPLGVQQADTFEVRYITYANGVASADCHLWTSGASPVEVGSQIVAASQAQCAAWSDDDAFFSVLAQNAGLVPI